MKIQTYKWAQTVGNVACSVEAAIWSPWSKNSYILAQLCTRSSHQSFRDWLDPTPVLVFKGFLDSDISTSNSSNSATFCLFFLVDSVNGSSEFESGDIVSTVTRVMVSQNRLYSDSEEVVALQVFSEVIEMDGKEVNTNCTALWQNLTVCFWFFLMLRITLE